MWMTATCFAQQAVDTTSYFQFYSDFWINLHHFLYQKAKGSQLAHLEEDGLGFLQSGESEALAALTITEQGVLDAAISYYREHLVDQSLRTALGPMRQWLADLEEQGEVDDTTFSLAFTTMLNQVAPIYRQHVWPIHQALNRSILDMHLRNIRTLESAVISKMEVLAMYAWPDVDKVRVDLTAYANYAGAYTATRPTMSIVISTLDSLNGTTSFVETTYHEGSHLLFNYTDSPFRGEIFHQAKESNQAFPRGLWHAALFYLCGRATQDALQTLSIPHVLDMDLRAIFASYNTPAFRATMENYYQGRVNLKKAIEELLSQLR